ncbi:MAG TPA: protein-methionine-sulfoxide reductase catalytic subunit MsrP, partial [Rudaea sp.]|nr:protein-methionine-sulfoxide reductase catalytic subunit MsrP [Rudaea sp.]
MKLLGLGATALAAGCGSEAAPPAPVVPETSVPGTPLAVTRRLDDADGAVRTTFQDATHYNNFYEFGTGKGDPAARSGAFQPRPWSVEIAGLAEKTGRFTLDDMLKGQALEERIYRMRCVEGWSMVIPWAGFPLADLLKRFKPLASAKYVAFTTIERPAQMPGLAYPVLDWPYREGLRMDEAMHPLTLLAVG